MSVSPSYKAFVLEQLSAAGAVTARTMFGGVGLYCQGLFFALIDDDTLYLKVDDASIPDFEREGSRQRVQLLVQTGLGFQPSFLWATTGPEPRLFAQADLAGEIFIEAGWAGNRKLLEARQRVAETQVLRDRAERQRHPLPGLTVVRNARIFDSYEAIVAACCDAWNRLRAIPGQI